MRKELVEADIRKLMHGAIKKVGHIKACYTVSKIISTVLNHKGIQAKVVFVRGVIANERAEQIRVDCGVEDWLGDIPDDFREIMLAVGGYTMSVGIGLDKNGAPNFHGIVYLPENNEVIDATITQMNRPLQDIVFKPFYGWATDYRKLFSPAAEFHLLDSEQIILEIFNPVMKREPEHFRWIVRELEKEME